MATVLIVEDDTMLQSAYATVLSEEGYAVFVAVDGVEGVELSRKHKPDLILLDMLMPNLNGLEFLRELNIKQSLPQTKVVVLSNMSVPSDVRSAKLLGANKYLTKSSFTPKEIVGIIKDVLA
jgi:two-component system phosphate regulon response regulator PhoB